MAMIPESEGYLLHVRHVQENPLTAEELFFTPNFVGL